MFSRLSPTIAALVLTTAPAFAQTQLSGNHYITGGLCVGTSCTGTDANNTANLRLKGSGPATVFQDTRPSSSSWILWANALPPSNFGLWDDTTNNFPFQVYAGAPGSSLTVAANGFLGLGTSMPQAEIHISTPDTPRIRFEQDGSATYPVYAWSFYGNETGMRLKNETTGLIPILFRPDAPGGALTIADAGLGIGTLYPTAAVHLSKSDGTAMLKVEETHATSNPRTLLNLQNNGRPEIVMGNTATNGEWSFGAGTDFFLKTGTVGSQSNAKTKVFTVKQNGDAIVAGTLTTGGTTCGSGCDLVFTEGYDLPSIAEHAKAMFALGHLPNVGPTVENQPVNLSDKLGRMLNELEHAHIYIAQLESRDRDRVRTISRQQAALAAQSDRIEGLEQRLMRIEAQLD